jgi:acyl-CoA synthetase (AMP-forming)/AMP-acid ligase II
MSNAIMPIDYKNILTNGITICSSGTSGHPSAYFQTPKKLKCANDVAISVQQLTKDSRVYTCCSLEHAGGLLAQTLPALSIGANVDIVKFSAYDFVRDVNKYTHTHITPLHAKAIMLTKGFDTLDLHGVWVTCGADPVTWNIIEAFVQRGATFMTNWGMSEVGPIAINTIFDSMEKINKYKTLAPTNATIMGDQYWCSVNIVDNELRVKGDICIFDSWFETKDKVCMINGVMYYMGRTNKEVDLWSPKKD